MQTFSVQSQLTCEGEGRPVSARQENVHKLSMPRSSRTSKDLPFCTYTATLTISSAPQTQRYSRPHVQNNSGRGGENIGASPQCSHCNKNGAGTGNPDSARIITRNRIFMPVEAFLKKKKKQLTMWLS